MMDPIDRAILECCRDEFRPLKPLLEQVPKGTLYRHAKTRRDTRQAQLRALGDRPAVGLLRVGQNEIRTRLKQLHELVQKDSARANTVFRQILEPITMTAVEEKGKRFYRATGAAKGAEMLDRLGLIQAVDFGGCGGPLCFVGKQLPGLSL